MLGVQWLEKAVTGATLGSTGKDLVTERGKLNVLNLDLGFLHVCGNGAGGVSDSEVLFRW